MRPTVYRATLGSVATFLSACAGTVAHPPYAPQPESALVEVVSPPPPGRVEVVPDRPNRGAVWVDGEWAWRRRRWAWSAGAWVDPPPGAAFSPWVFVRGPDGTFWYAPGTWRDAKGVGVTPPEPLVAARVDSSAVVDASGLTENTGTTLKPQAAAPAGQPGASPPRSH